MLKILLLGMLAFAASEKLNFDGYQVFRILPTQKYQVDALQNWSNSETFDFWNSPTEMYRSIDVMVSPQKRPLFHNWMTDLRMAYTTHIRNVQALIDNENEYRVDNSNYHSNYHPLTEIYNYLHQLANEHSDKVQIIVGGRSYEGRNIMGVKVTFNKDNPGIFIEGGIHAREWIAPATVTYILDQLLNSNDPEVRFLAERHNWFVFPVFNPDGYEYSHTKDRLWRRTRTPYQKCIGADMNRNFNFEWRKNDNTADPCSSFFGGNKPNSEIEVKSISRYIKSIRNKFYAYISFHSYSQLLLFPYGHTTDHLDNYDDLYAIGLETIKALAQRYNTRYTTGSVAEILYIATGSSVDWVKGVLRKPICFTYELPDKGQFGFLLPPEQIIPTGEETLDSLIVMFNETASRKYP